MVGGVIRIPLLAQYRQQGPIYLDDKNKRFHTSARVVAMSGEVIYATNSHGPVTMYLDPRADIWKGAHGSPASALKAGDSLSVKGYLDDRGRLIATSLFANIASFDGVITSLGKNAFTVIIQAPAGGQNGAIRVIEYDDKTVFESAANKDDLQIGRAIHLIGLAREDTAVLATRITIYDEKTHAPVHSEGGRTLMPDGRIK